MFPRVEQYVAEREVDGARGAQGAGVVAVCEDATGSRELAVDGSRQANAEALHAARERLFVLGLGDQVEVVALHGVVNEPEAEAPLSCARAFCTFAKSVLVLSEGRPGTMRKVRCRG